MSNWMFLLWGIWVAVPLAGSIILAMKDFKIKPSHFFAWFMLTIVWLAYTVVMLLVTTSCLLGSGVCK